MTLIANKGLYFRKINVMGAPLGNCNACTGYKGWYKRSNARKNLRYIKRQRMGGSVSSGARKYLRGMRSIAQDQQTQLAKLYATRFKAEMRKQRQWRAMGGGVLGIDK